jgi:hypothetical protein
MSSSNVKYEVTSRSLEDVVQSIEDGSLMVASHQRTSDNWTLSQQQKLIDSIDNGIPMPSVLIRKHKTGVESLEDGLQRVTGAKAFIQGQFKTQSNESFNDLSEMRKARFLTYKVPTVVYQNAKDEQAVEIFIRFQAGTALSVGQLLHAFTDMSPLVRLAKKTLLTKGEGFHDRAAKIWGVRSSDDKKRNNLKNASALIAGLAHGSGMLSRKWIDFQTILTKEIDEVAVIQKLDRMFKIYEEVNVRQPVPGKRNMNGIWNFGNGIGYIVYTMNLSPEDLYKATNCNNNTEIDAAWARILTNYRIHPNLIDEELHAELSVARSWVIARWKNGVRSVFRPETFETDPAERTSVSDDTEEDEDDE